MEKPSAAPVAADAQRYQNGMGLVVLVQCIGKNPCWIQRFSSTGGGGNVLDIVPPGCVQALSPFDTLWLVRDVCPLKLCVLRTSQDDPSPQSSVRLSSREVLRAMVHGVLLAAARPTEEQASGAAALLSSAPLVLSPGVLGTHVSSSDRSSIQHPRQDTAAGAGSMLTPHDAAAAAAAAVVVVDSASSRKRGRSLDDAEPVLIAPPLALRPCEDEDGILMRRLEFRRDATAAAAAVGAACVLMSPAVQVSEYCSVSGSLAGDDIGCCDTQLAQLEAFAGAMHTRKVAGLDVPRSYGGLLPTGQGAEAGFTVTGAALHRAVAPTPHAEDSQFVFFDHNI
jgi:hypothetical protein